MLYTPGMTTTTEKQNATAMRRWYFIPELGADRAIFTNWRIGRNRTMGPATRGARFNVPVVVSPLRAFARQWLLAPFMGDPMADASLVKREWKAGA